MADPLLNEDAFSNDKSQKLFEVIDKLHSCGAKAYIDIPEIIIVGDQSVGKSSLLQSLTDIPFPVADRLCTRFPTRIVSQRTPGGPDVIKVTIEAAPFEFFTAAPMSEKEQKYANFRPNGVNLSEDDFAKAVDDAMHLMGISDDPDAPVDSPKAIKKPNFCSDVLRIELLGPNRSHFSILDVPGVFHSRTGDVTAQEIDGVKRLVAAEMRRRQSIVVCVADATSNMANQVIFEMVSKEDPHGERTLGVITKCDCTQDADMVVQFAQNNRKGGIYFQNGWFVVRNRSPLEILERIDSVELHRREEELFNGAPWNKLPSSRRGVQALEKYLGDLLCHRMQKAFPKMLAEIQERRRSTSDMLESLGQERSTIEQKRSYLTRISQRFNAIAVAVLLGRYESVEGDHLKLRKQVRDANDSFMQELKLNGHRVPFVPLPVLHHLQTAGNQALQGTSQPTESVGLGFENPGPLTVQQDSKHNGFGSANTSVPTSGSSGFFGGMGFNHSNSSNPFGASNTSNGTSTVSAYKSTATAQSQPPTQPSSSIFGSAQTPQSTATRQPTAFAFASKTMQSSMPQKSTTSLFGSAPSPQSQPSNEGKNRRSAGFGNIEQHDAEIYRWIRDEIKSNRGTELQGTLNSDILPMLFHQQTHKWGNIAEKHFIQVKNCAVSVLNGILENIVCDQITRAKIWPRILEAGNAGETAKLRDLRERFERIKSRHLQTSNAAFEEKVAQARYLRFQAALDRYRVSKMDPSDDLDDSKFVVDMRDTAALFSELHISNSRNLENEIHDTLKAYYEIARDDYIEYVTQHIVEDFINEEDGPVLFFSPWYVAGLSDNDIEELAMEDEDVLKQRTQQEAVLERLKHAESIALEYA